jgi:hypothetical protein
MEVIGGLELVIVTICQNGRIDVGATLAVAHVQGGLK